MSFVTHHTRRRRRADGVVEDAGRIGRAKRDRAEVIELVPGDAAEVEAVKTMFRMARDGAGYRTIAQHLNDRGVPPPDAGRAHKIATMPNVWSASTVRAILMNPAYAGDAIWNVRSMPKFHRLENDKIVALDEFDTSCFRRNDKSDWVVKRDAHAALVDRATFDAVQRKIESRPSTTRGHVREYLLTGLITCVHCGDVMVGTTRTRKKLVGGTEKTYSDPLYTCAATLRATGRCRQVALPRDGLERAILRVLDEEILRPDALARLEHHLRLVVERRQAGNKSDGVAALEQRALDLKNRIAEGARRILQVGEELIVEVRAALAELKAELERVQAQIEAKRRHSTLPADGEALVRTTLDEFRSMAVVLRDPTFPLERRREVLRRLLPMRDGVRPILVYIDPKAPRGWRKALKRVTVRHLTVGSTQQSTSSVGSLVAGAESFADGLPVLPRRARFEGVAASNETLLSVEDLLIDGARDAAMGLV